MSDKKTATGERSRHGARKHTAAGNPDREVQLLMERTGGSYSQMLALLHRYPHDRASIERAAQRLRPK